jgi:hypothetical protein
VRSDKSECEASLGARTVYVDPKYLQDSVSLKDLFHKLRLEAEEECTCSLEMKERATYIYEALPHCHSLKPNAGKGRVKWMQVAVQDNKSWVGSFENVTGTGLIIAETDCIQLAKVAPHLAVRNVANYGWFAIRQLLES